jgi:hypothetical protein
MTPADKCLLSLIMDLTTVLIHDPQTHHGERSRAARRLQDARRGGWEGFDALVRRATAPPDAVWTPSGVVGAAEPKGVSGGQNTGVMGYRYGHLIAGPKIPERY